ncbi:MAG: beta-1,6-N-acetylglucosaminyltransferase [Spirochaetales bacterium]|nr:beta-1,6-N-acetylglucosaminyltransferase [Spirochaetales bacterium]
MEKHAYLIIAHQNIWQLKILLNQIDDYRNDIYLFIDKKSIKQINNLSDIKSTIIKSNINIYSPFSINWGGDSQWRAELFLLEQANKTKIYRYFHLLSGSDLLLHSQDYIHNFFKQYDGYEFLAFVGKDIYMKVNPINRVKYYYILQDLPLKSKTLKKVRNLISNIFINIQKLLNIDRLKDSNLEIAYGTNWFSITNELVKYILSEKKVITRVFKHSFCSDELFIHTLVINSQFINKVFITEGLRDCKNDRQGSLRYINWWDGSPKTWSINDKLELMEASKRGYIIARKFDENKDKDIICYISDNVKCERNFTITTKL